MLNNYEGDSTEQVAASIGQNESRTVSTPSVTEGDELDLSFVPTPARVALYDDLKSAPRITEVAPGETAQYIETLTNIIYEQAKMAGGTISYTVIREVTENFIHAYFREVIVSILDNGNTIRFADQGPGIAEAEKAQLPGFTSAIEPMKHYIRGVGSGLPIVRDYLDAMEGTITIEDNISNGAVVTISKALTQRSGTAVPTDAPSRTQDTRARYQDYEQAQVNMALSPLSARERTMLVILYKEGPLGVTALAQLGEAPASSTHVILKKLEEAGLIETIAGKKRALTPLGHSCAESLALQ